MIAPRIAAVTALAASVVLAAAMASAAMAQTSVAQGAQPGPQNDLASRTAAVRGVVTSDTGTPVSGVEVRLAGSEWHRLTTTDAAGRFVFRDLPAEVMRVHASKAGFVDAQYGPFALAPEQRETAALTLGRSGVIYGHVFDEVGEPAAGALVEALLAVSVEGLRKRLQSVGGGDLADDTGAFRLYGLPPGTYFVSARPGPAGTANRGAATYYPGTPGVATALPLEVETGSQVAVSLSLGAVPLARVSGVLVNADGTPTFGNVTLLPQVGMAPREPDDRVSVDVEGTRLSSNAGPDGRFTIADVPPGPYELTGTRGRPGETASLPVLVSGQDITGLTVVTRPQAP